LDGYPDGVTRAADRDRVDGAGVDDGVRGELGHQSDGVVAGAIGVQIDQRVQDETPGGGHTLRDRLKRQRRGGCRVVGWRRLGG
jgi:hypothetical protein